MWQISIRKNAKIKEVFIRLGHSNISITVDIYTQYLPEDDNHVAEMVENF